MEQQARRAINAYSQIQNKEKLKTTQSEFKNSIKTSGIYVAVLYLEILCLLGITRPEW